MYHTRHKTYTVQLHAFHPSDGVRCLDWAVPFDLMRLGGGTLFLKIYGGRDTVAASATKAHLRLDCRPASIIADFVRLVSAVNLI